MFHIFIVISLFSGAADGLSSIHTTGNYPRTNVKLVFTLIDIAFNRVIVCDQALHEPECTSPTSKTVTETSASTPAPVIDLVQLIACYCYPENHRISTLVTFHADCHRLAIQTLTGSTGLLHAGRTVAF